MNRVCSQGSEVKILDLIFSKSAIENLKYIKSQQAEVKVKIYNS